MYSLQTIRYKLFKKTNYSNKDCLLPLNKCFIPCKNHIFDHIFHGDIDQCIDFYNFRIEKQTTIKWVETLILHNTMIK